MKPTVFITVDTEEDNWGIDSCGEVSTKNAEGLARFQSLCEGYAAVPTYLIDMPMATVEPARSILREISRQPCELGAHCHPWNTPPIEEDLGPRNSMLSNLPPRLVKEKLKTLHGAIAGNLDVIPVSFRAGRWALSPAVGATLVDLRYTVDSSVSPFIDWSDSFGPDYRTAPVRPYRFDPEKPLEPKSDGRLLQVPATVGFFQGDQLRALRFRERVRRCIPAEFRALGILDRLRLLNLRWLSPETSEGSDLVRLAKTLVGNGVPCLNLSFHSCSLKPGLSPYVGSQRDLEEFYARIEEFLDFAKGAGMGFRGLGEAPSVFGPAGTAAQGVDPIR